MHIFAVLLLLFSLAGNVPLRPRALPQWLVTLYYTFSYVGQTFAIPLLFVSALLVVWSWFYGNASLWTMGIGAVASAVFLLNHLNSHFAGRRLFNALSDAVAPGAQAPVPPMSGLLPSYGRRKDVRRIADIPYADGRHGRNLLDIYVPEQAVAAPMPVVIQIHGGAWILGDKHQQGQPLLHYLASRGWMAVAVNYRLAPAHRMDDIFSDVLRSIAWVKRHAVDYGGDPDFIAVTGGSAGGHLAALCALQPNNQRFKPGFEGVDCSVDVAIPVYGRYDLVDSANVLGKGREYLIEFLAQKVMPDSLEADPAIWDLTSPVKQVHADAPPFLVIGCRHDCMVPTAEGRYFSDTLRRVSGNPVIYQELSSGQHAFDVFSTPLTEYHVRTVAIFLENQLKKKACK